jgi:methyltransferase
MVSLPVYLGLLAAVAAERLAELRVARRHARLARERGGREHGRAHYPVMVVLHVALLAGCLLETVLLRRPAWPGISEASVVVAVGCQALRWWCIRSLGTRWNTRVIVVPGDERVVRGPYRWLRHPNYVAVVVEGVALPLAHGAWLTATLFTLADAALLSVRLRCEERALTTLRPTV